MKKIHPVTVPLPFRTLWDSARQLLAISAVGLAALAGSSALGGETLIIGEQYTAWPSTWTEIPALRDGAADTGTRFKRFDFVGDSTGKGTVYWASDANYIYFRVRVNTATFNLADWADSMWIYIGKGGSGAPMPDFAFGWDSVNKSQVAKHGLEMQIYNTGSLWPDLKLNDIDGDPANKTTADINGNNRDTDGYIRALDGFTGTTDANTTFIDWAVSWAYLANTSWHPGYALLPTDTLYVAVGATAIGNDHSVLGTYSGQNSDLAGVVNYDSTTITEGGLGWSAPLSPQGHVCAAGDTTRGWSGLVNVMTLGYTNIYGLQSVAGVKAQNCTLTYTAYANLAGTIVLAGPSPLAANYSPVTLPPGTIKVIVLGTRTITSLPAVCNAEVVDSCGTFNTRFDPVFTVLEVGTSGEIWEVFRDIPAAERYVSVCNHTPGLSRARIIVNGQTFLLAPLLDGETQTVDVGEAMNPGTDNTVVVVGEGPVGASALLVIADSVVGEPLLLPATIALQIEPEAGGFRVSWPDAAGFVLQSESSLAPTAAWMNWPEPPTMANGRLSVHVPAGSSAQLFRLAKP